ncbi:uncharacterized protein LOC134781675 [Penaeus indicus]|uniref:polyubiquitin 8-like n=1 Tax=Penaeus chinensis TaxID=139456 RepID=UPI001FB74764|nr:polyubiquitin 8-like [Penaeus chinensis]XP_047482429.1 polyubiquitin 8-like [Penaeus chinensis]
MFIHIIIPTGRRIVVEADRYDTIKRVKEVIGQKEDVPAEDLRLHHAGQLLDDDRTLDRCDITEGSKLTLRFRLREDEGGQPTFLLHVVTPTDKTVSVEVGPATTGRQLKTLIRRESEEAFWESEQHLLVRDLEMQDDKTLADYGITKETVIRMQNVPCLRLHIGSSRESCEASAYS